MLRVTLEGLPDGLTKLTKTLGVIEIAASGDLCRYTDGEVGDYNVMESKRIEGHSPSLSTDVCFISHFKRERGAWALVAEAVKALMEEKT